MRQIHDILKEKSYSVYELVIIYAVVVVFQKIVGII